MAQQQQQQQQLQQPVEMANWQQPVVLQEVVRDTPPHA